MSELVIGNIEHPTLAVARRVSYAVILPVHIVRNARCVGGTVSMASWLTKRFEASQIVECIEGKYLGQVVYLMWTPVVLDHPLLESA
jgi:hypothetical protein